MKIEVDLPEPVIQTLTLLSVRWKLAFSETLVTVLNHGAISIHEKLEFINVTTSPAVKDLIEQVGHFDPDNFQRNSERFRSDFGKPMLEADEDELRAFLSSLACD